MEQAKKRVHYADVAKGILIILLFLHHLHIHVRPELCDISNPVTLFLDNIDDYWVMSFMASFFVLSGSFTNFQKPFQDFLKSNFKSLIIPSVTIGIINGIIFQSTIGGMGNYGYLSTFKNAIIKFFEYGGSLWFCSALFLAKNIYWLVLKYAPKLDFVICALLSFIGIALGVCFNNGYIHVNVWYFIHALIFIVFLWFGVRIKTLNLPIKLLYIVPVYGAFVYYLQQMDKVTYVTYSFSYHDFDVLFFYGMAIIGTLLLISFSKWINSNSILEYIGRNSLVFYGLHPFVNTVMTYYMRDLIIGSSLYIQILIYAFILSTMFFVCVIFASLLNTKYLRFSLGKF